ncbi:EamA family transporter RarD [Agrococcus sediminis]|jgi:chloramphenicol-sensitive protein RarD|uniref:EamA family transporter RarD n=1 Tax=Agrococcus TaxID=46352 RepID=UPI000FE3C8B6|nr:MULTISPECIES: EamA family transporter RarD [unclassified Agrococcus]MDR7233332.1 chloramphenicol-sensitive protein RarD [Agrococcus sp. BE272]RWR21275.1 EamA family transporter RarD [Agrococcus lahaulensis]UOV99694.1 EamA family transporter RarD [Agrococcus sp. SCSIO52902]
MGEHPGGRTRAGIWYAVFAYAFWGVVPVYLQLTKGIDGFELIGWRVIASVVVGFALVAATRGWSRLAGVLRSRRDTVSLVLAGCAVLVNWTAFFIGVLSDRVLETSLGYFLNPLVSVVLAVAFLGERLRPVQWVAVGLGALGVLVMVVGYGEVPWIGLTVALSFGVYGLIKKRVGGSVDALSGFTIETVAALPAALVMMGIAISLQGVTVGANGAAGIWGTVGLGVITAVPLLAFAAAARRISLTALAFTQYLAPIISFLFGAFVMLEPMPLERWIGFALVWASLALVSLDLLGRHARRPRPEPAAA